MTSYHFAMRKVGRVKSGNMIGSNPFFGDPKLDSSGACDKDVDVLGHGSDQDGMIHPNWAQPA